MNVYFLFISVFFGFACSAQMSKEDEYISCRIKKMKTCCIEKPSDPVSRISCKDSEYVSGRYEDFNEELSSFQLQKFRQNISCYSQDSIVYNEDRSKIIYSHEGCRNLSFYYRYHHYYSSKSTVKNPEWPEFSRYNAASAQNYLIFYNKKHENDDSYEMYHHIFNFKGQMIYTFHQHGREFDEFVYKTNDESEIKYAEENPVKKTRIYKNGKLYSVVKTVTDFKNGNRKKIRTYGTATSYISDKGGMPLLIESKYTAENQTCGCKKGFITEIQYQPDGKCEREVIFD